MTKTFELTTREAELLEGAIRTAIGVYRQMIPAASPAFGVDDQPAETDRYDADWATRTTAIMLTLASLETLRDDMERALYGRALLGPIAITYSREEVADSPDNHELTLEHDGRPTGAGHLVLSAVFHANMTAQHRHVPTMNLLDRLV